VAAFRATLEEIYMADILVHVVDASSSLWKKQKKSVDETLEDMGVADKPTIVLYNKVDLLEVRRKKKKKKKKDVTISCCGCWWWW